jgi:hypothetical protein
MLIRKAHSWGMIHCIDKLIKQVDAPFARRSSLGNPLQAVSSFSILIPGFLVSIIAYRYQELNTKGVSSKFIPGQVLG